MEADSGGVLNVEADFGGGFQYGGEFWGCFKYGGEFRRRFPIWRRIFLNGDEFVSHVKAKSVNLYRRSSTRGDPHKSV
jgi:hypothetical protein